MSPVPNSSAISAGSGIAGITMQATRPALTTSQPTSTRRGGSRSAAAPNSTPPTRYGTNDSAITDAASAGDRVCSYTSTVSATEATTLPSIDARLAAKITRNSPKPRTRPYRARAAAAAGSGLLTSLGGADVDTASTLAEARIELQRFGYSRIQGA